MPDTERLSLKDGRTVQLANAFYSVYRDDWKLIHCCTSTKSDFLTVLKGARYEPRWASQGARGVKNPPANAGDVRDVGSIPGLGRCPGGGNGNLLQYSCLENSTDRGARQATVHEVTKSRTQLSTDARACVHTHTHTHTSLYGLVCQGWSCNHSSVLRLFSSAPRSAAVVLAKKIPGSPRRNRDLIHLQELSWKSPLKCI